MPQNTSCIAGRAEETQAESRFRDEQYRQLEQQKDFPLAGSDACGRITDYTTGQGSSRTSPTPADDRSSHHSTACQIAKSKSLHIKPSSHDSTHAIATRRLRHSRSSSDLHTTAHYSDRLLPPLPVRRTSDTPITPNLRHSRAKHIWKPLPLIPPNFPSIKTVLADEEPGVWRVGPERKIEYVDYMIPAARRASMGGQIVGLEPTRRMRIVPGLVRRFRRRSKRSREVEMVSRLYADELFDNE